MTTSHTTTTTISSTAGPSRSRPVPPPPPTDPAVHKKEGLEDKDEDNIIGRAQERVEKVRARKAAAVAKKAAEEKAAGERVAQEAREQALRVHQQEEEIMEGRRLLAEAATTRSQRGTSPSEMSASPRRPVAEIRRKMISKGTGKAKAQPVSGDPDDGDNGDDKEDRAPCERCKNKKLPCQMQAGKRSSIICKPCHDTKVRCSYSVRPTTSKQREGSSGERITIMESQMAQSLADLQALREADLKTHQYLRQLLRKQEDDHARLIAMETRMAMLGMGGASATAGPSRRTTKRRQPLKRRKVVEESDEEDEEEKDKNVEKEMEEDGEGEVEKEGERMEAKEEGEGKAPARTVTSEKGKETEVVE
ncbi:hypothetical protein F5879DRAFT_992758 [Lentinula edodes]|nr:hypothetical protein F5879DRAFT_992758 [Lentinula edodes]